MNSELNIEQNVCLYNRSSLELTGISDVTAFSDTVIEAEYSGGCIAVEGSDLKIEEFSSETGRLKVCGLVNGFFYYGNAKKTKKGILRR